MSEGSSPILESAPVKSAVFESQLGSTPQRRRHRADQIEAAYEIQRVSSMEPYHPKLKQFD